MPPNPQITVDKFDFFSILNSYSLSAAKNTFSRLRFIPVSGTDWHSVIHCNHTLIFCAGFLVAVLKKEPIK